MGRSHAAHFAQHLVDRYGIDEVAQWYFEVWNEPNIDFWSGIPSKQRYFELYDHTARALKAVSPRLRVGGPATSAAHWVDAFFQTCRRRTCSRRFYFDHGYADDTVEDHLGTNEDIPMDRTCLSRSRKCTIRSRHRRVPGCRSDVDGMECPILRPLNAGPRHRICRPALARRHQAMRWHGEHDVVLDVQRRLRRRWTETRAF